MTHECNHMDKEEHRIKFDDDSIQWIVEELVYWGPPYQSVTGIRFCPFCGVELDNN